MKTSELTGVALDWAVAKCEGLQQGQIAIDGVTQGFYAPSTNWAQGGPIIEREMIAIQCLPKKNGGFVWRTVHADGPTPLIAAMRCYVASKLGDEIEIPSNFFLKGNLYESIRLFQPTQSALQREGS